MDVRFNAYAVGGTLTHKSLLRGLQPRFLDGVHDDMPRLLRHFDVSHGAVDWAGRYVAIDRAPFHGAGNDRQIGALLILLAWQRAEKSTMNAPDVRLNEVRDRRCQLTACEQGIVGRVPRALTRRLRAVGKLRPTRLVDAVLAPCRFSEALHALVQFVIDGLREALTNLFEMGGKAVKTAYVHGEPPCFPLDNLTHIGNSVSMPRNEQRKIEYTEHAEYRLKTRRVTKQDVETIVRGGTWREDGVGDFGEPKWIAAGSYAGRWIEVVFVETEDNTIEILLVLTVY
jgi:hypothetical protein